MTTRHRRPRIHPRRATAAASLALAVLAVLAGSCGAVADEPQPAGVPINRSALDPAAKAAVTAPEVNAIDPQFPISNASRFSVVVLGKVLGFADGPTFVDYEGDAEPGPDWVVMEVEPVAVLRGEEQVGDPIYVQLTLSDREGLAKAIPPGTLTFVAAQPVDPADDQHLADPYAGVPAGRTRYLAGAPYVAVADGPGRIWYPVSGQSHDRPLTALVPGDLAPLLPAEVR
ncbi:hypothetical protein F9L07_07240 [Pimelobacter simplex]|uniref:Lipoprotein n=1 Tax=Nocardioides simplex TaxID=2045 RepID=A0A7J5E070_NOCSI|nr:hypothetical protein [Pimelobacter simplex]KAB2811650.1 hypothetical protein F9L07_07240 [Pimelobacter simplex]